MIAEPAQTTLGLAIKGVVAAWAYGTPDMLRRGTWGIRPDEPICETAGPFLLRDLVALAERLTADERATNAC